MSIQRSYFFIFTIMLVFFTSCRKEIDTVAIINVVDIDSVVQPGINVRMFGEPSTDNQGEVQEIAIDREQTTDSNGKAEFNFTDDFELGQSGFAVLNVEVTVGDSIYETILKVEAEETTEETIIIN